MPSNLIADMSTAVQDFKRARRKAALQELIARITGQPVNLLPYEEVRRMLRTQSQKERGLHDIPIDAIIGSVGRYTDFTRDFLPKQDSDAGRWARVKVQAVGLKGLPPIEVYKIGEAYFVRDGNHRVSVARELGADHIQAYVTEVESDVPVSPDMDFDDLILKAEYSDFLKWSHLKELRPDAELMLTAPGRYDDLKEHIQVHQYYMGIDKDRPVSRGEAVAHWYDYVYRPVIDIIGRLDLLQDFPDRTEADLYLWMAEHQAALREGLGWEVDQTAAAENLAEAFSSKPERILSRLGERFMDTLTPQGLSPSPPTGTWRESRMTRYGAEHRLLRNVLVTLNGEESGWQALNQALEIARREDGHILGLHIVPNESDTRSEAALETEARFTRRCQEGGIPGELAIETGSIASEITKRARWADLIVAPLNYPPGSDIINKLKSGFRTMIIRSPCPVLALPNSIFPLEHALLAYDGSTQSREALFLATYLVCRFEIELTVATAGEDSSFVEVTLGEARSYLEARNIEAEYLDLHEASVAEAIREAASAQETDLILMGSYGRTALLEMVLGSTVNDVLRTSRRPVLICR